MHFFFQPSDIVNQVLNFGQPSPIDIRVSGPDGNEDYKLVEKADARSRVGPGSGGCAYFSGSQCAPRLDINVDRTLATEFGINQQDVVNNILVATNSSAQTTPNFWVDPRNNVSYPLVVQMPTYHINSAQDLRTIPVTVRKQQSGGPTVDQCR